MGFDLLLEGTEKIEEVNDGGSEGEKVNWVYNKYIVPRIIDYGAVTVDKELY